MKDRRVTIGLCFALAISFSAAKPNDNRSADRLKEIKTVYVRPVNPDSSDAAFEAHKTLAESDCIKVSERAETADAILEISSEREGNWIRYPFGRQRVSGSAALLDRKTRNAVWTDDRSSRWLPSRSDAGHVIALDLIAEHGCETGDSTSWEPFKEVKSGARSNPSAVPGNAVREAGQHAPEPNAAPASSSPHAPEKVIQRGMTYTQVEAVLGPPSTRANLGEKTVYKYPDLTVEFRGGKVTDVR